MTKKVSLLVVLLCVLGLFVSIVAVRFTAPKSKDFYQNYVRNIDSVKIEYVNYPDEDTDEITKDDIDYVVGDIQPKDAKQLKQILKQTAFSLQTDQVPSLGGSFFMLRCYDETDEVFALIDCNDGYLWVVDTDGNVYRRINSEDTDIAEFVSSEQEQSGFVPYAPEDTSTTDWVLTMTDFEDYQENMPYTDIVFENATSTMIKTYNESVEDKANPDTGIVMEQEEKDPVEQFSDYTVELLNVAEQMDDMELNGETDSDTYKELKERYDELWIILFGEEEAEEG